jgi:hypothetical protein
MHRLQVWPSASYLLGGVYDAPRRLNGATSLLVVFALMTPVGLQQDAVDLL